MGTCPLLWVDTWPSRHVVPLIPVFDAGMVIALNFTLPLPLVFWHARKKTQVIP